MSGAVKDSLSAPDKRSEEPVDHRRWIALGVVLTAAFMVLLDISIVNVAIPSIQTNLKATFAQIQLILALYQLAYAVVLITGGRLGDIYGRKRLFMIGMAGFVLASASCGLAQSPEMLIVSRVVQGLCAALMYPQVLSVIQVSFPAAERAKAFALFGAIIGLATITGPLLGGVLIQMNLFGLDWRPIFLVNVPVGIASLIAAGLLMRESRSPQALKLDLAGVAIVSTALFLLVWPLVEGREAGWPAWTYICLAACLPVFLLFVAYERWETARNGSPLVVLALFRVRAFVVGLLISMFFLAGIPAFFLTFSLYLQIGLGFSALHAGLTTLPFAVGSFFASAASARAAARLGRNVLFAGSVILLVGMALVLLTIHLAGISISTPEFIPSLLICGLGLGSVIAPLVNVILAGIPSRDAGSASGLLTTVQQVGGAIGVAVIGVIFFGLLGTNSAHIGREVAPGLQSDLVAIHVPTSAVNASVKGFLQCFHDRSNSSDPTQIPPSCQRTAKPGTAAFTAFRRTADTARERDFSESFSTALLFEFLCFGATFFLILLLPTASPAALAREGGLGGH